MLRRHHNAWRLLLGSRQHRASVRLSTSEADGSSGSPKAPAEKSKGRQPLVIKEDPAPPLPQTRHQVTWAVRDREIAAQRLAAYERGEEPDVQERQILMRPEQIEEIEDSKSLVVRSSTTTGQVLYPATPEDIAILTNTDRRYVNPIEAEGSVIIRVVRLSDPVTSPVGRVVRNRQFGIRKGEKWRFLMWGLAASGFVYSLGAWQLYRMKWKADLIERRRNRLAGERTKIAGSPFPWNEENMDEWEYRLIEVHGVFDHEREMLVGPRPTLEIHAGLGYNVVTPFRLEDGNSILVNRGHVPLARANPATRKESPEWVTVRGVLECGEIANTAMEFQRIKNRPHEGKFLYILPKDLAQNANVRNHSECEMALLTAYDYMYDEDAAKVYQRRRDLPYKMKHRQDYLIFWADEHTHFNYACQWFALGSLLMGITIHKLVQVIRWKW
mmetsp:Transcript_18229/g.40275  ORF Transcript_18229/g.40275 Transcript_18229/m.40275 type:complete len:442 (-) Transcript_18229:178-1503(-)